MGFFTQLSDRLDRLAESVFDWLVDVTTWAVEKLTIFVKTLFQKLQKIWPTLVAPVLIAAFGELSILYVIFYAGAVLGQTIMEIWDPIYVNSKSSQVFKLEQAPQISPLPELRSESRVLKLENYY
ncbi:MAG: hypothetical protein F6K31_04270 [Symploca sp. SIO2G7]|nr:hypothetical protein [Symploca sp. SIO2G7]